MKTSIVNDEENKSVRLRPTSGGTLRILVIVALLSVPLHYAFAGVITYTFGDPNNNMGTMAIGYPLTPQRVGGALGFLVDFPLDNKGMIKTFDVATKATETQKSKQDKIVAYIKANLPNTLQVAPQGNNQVKITIPAADLANLKKAGKTPGIGVMATGGVETGGFLKAKDDPTIGLIEFQGIFTPVDQAGATATFTAGISSDFGSPPPDVLYPSAFASLNGASIAEQFYSDLLPVASALHIGLAYVSPAPNDGDIFVYFPSGTAKVDGGVVFGTTSSTGTVIGAINAEAPEPSTLVLLGSSLVGLCGWLRHRSAAQS